MTAIGIDLGTTYSCVGVYHHFENKIDIIKNNIGKEKTPSYVSFTDDGILVGEEAENYAIVNPTNTVFDIQTLIGRKYTDQKVQDGIKYWPFKVISDESSKPYIEVQFKGETKHFTPEEIITIILKHMKELAENYLKEKVKDVVITVPATFGIIERQSIMNSCLNAELNVIGLIPKSVAAAIAFHDYNKSKKERTVLVYDFGGGLTESSIVDIYGSMLFVKSMSGEPNLGGENINNNMFDYFVNCFHEKYKNNYALLPRSLMLLRKSWEENKKILTTVEKTSIKCKSFYNNQDFNESISRSKFEEINKDLFESAMNPIRQVLKDSNILKNQITDIVLMGGSSRIKIIQSKITELLPEIQITTSVNPDTSSAYGAALYAAAKKKEKLFCCTNSLAYSLGYKNNNNNTVFLLHKNMTFPIKKTLTTMADSLPEKTLKVFEGENKFIGEFNLGKLSEKVNQIEITFNVNELGILEILVNDISARKEHRITTNDFCLLKQNEINKQKSNEDYENENINLKEKVRILEEEKKQITEKYKLYEKSNKDYENENLNLKEKVRILEEEKKQITGKYKLYEKSNEDYENENINLKEKVRILEEEKKQITGKCKLYEKYLLSLKENPRKLQIIDFDEYMEEDESLIGYGATSKIKIVWKKEQYAKKELVQCNDNKTKQRFISECEILFNLRHPCIVRIYGYSFGDDTHYPSIIMSREPRSLEIAIKNKELNCEQKNRIAVELVLGMRYIHKHKFMHRDLKSMNILLSNKSHVRIADFGLAKEVDLETSQTEGVGSLRFMAPELLNNEKNYTNKVDVYSFGIILFFIVTNGYPELNLSKVISGFHPKLPDDTSKWVSGLISSCLSNMPENRPSFEEIFNILKENNYDLFNDSKNKKLTVEQRQMKKNIEKRITKIESFEFQQKL